MKIKELIECLNEKDQDAEVEFIICKKDGELVCIELKEKSKDMMILLRVLK